MDLNDGAAEPEAEEPEPAEELDEEPEEPQGDGNEDDGGPEPGPAPAACPVLPAQRAWRDRVGLAKQCVQLAHCQRGLNVEACHMSLAAAWGEDGPPAVQLAEARISFCICCFNRGWQLELAMAVNLMTTGRFSPHSVRFVVALYEGANGAQTRDWIEANFQEELASGTLVVGWLNDLSSFHSSRCKNVSHVLSLMVPWGQGQVSQDGLTSWAFNFDRSPTRWEDFANFAPATASLLDNRRHLLINLDADNVLPIDFPLTLCRNHLVSNLLAEGPNRMFGFRYTAGADPGCTGRVGMTQESFAMIGGYDQSFQPTGYQDIDVFERLKSAGGKDSALRLTFAAGWSIPNDTDRRRATIAAKTENCGTGVKWHVQNTANMQASKEKLAQGRWWRNVTQCPTPQTALPALGDITGLRSVTLMAAGRPPTATAPSSSGRTPPQPPNPPAQAMPMPKPMPRDLPEQPARRPRAAAPPSLPAPPPRVAINLVTCGVGNLGWTLESASGVDMLPWQRRQAKVLRQQCMDDSTGRMVDVLKLLTGGLTPVVPAAEHTVIIDCRDFYDPDSDKSLRMHVGFHPQILQSTSKCARILRRLFSKVRQAIATVRSGRPNSSELPSSSSGGRRPTLNVICYCRSGNHRSVAFAQLLFYALQGSHLVESVVRSDVTEMSGNWRTRQCGPCQICRGFPGQQQAAADQAALDFAIAVAKSCWQPCVAA